MDWLKNGLVSSTARFKIIMNSVPITDVSDVYGPIAQEDRWQGYPADRTEILQHIEDQGVAGVLWVSGDFHWGTLATVGRPGQSFDGQYEVLAGPAGSFINPLAYLFQTNAHYLGILTDWNTTLFEADPAMGTIRIAFIGDNGNVLFEETVAV